MWDDIYQPEQPGNARQEYMSSLRYGNERSSLFPPLMTLDLATNRNLYVPKSTITPEIRKLFVKLFNGKDIRISFQEVLPFASKVEKPRVCNKDTKSRQINFRCFDCLIHQGSIICSTCFREGNHKNHRYIQVKEQGFCDCGNEMYIKQTGFCKNHQKRVSKDQSIPFNQAIVFELYIKQVFIWIFRIWTYIDKKQGSIFLYHFLQYLRKINTNSPYYNQLTTKILFDHQITIMSEIVKLCFVDFIYKEEITKEVLSFLVVMVRYSRFAELFFPIYIKVYNGTEGFQNSKLNKLTPILLNDSVAIKKSMRIASQSLNPCKRSYDPCTYYNTLLILRFLDTQSGQLFLAPLLRKSIIPSPYLQKIESLCQNSHCDILTLITSNMQEEYLYYRLLFFAIGVVNDKKLLVWMMRNYLQKMMKCKFNKNKIVLIPHRILTLLIFKYFDFQLNKINAKQLMQVLQIELKMFLIWLDNYIEVAINCLTQYSLNLVRNTYFFNYRSIYIKQQSQIVMTDYLSVKIMAQLVKSQHKQDTFHQKIIQIYTRKAKAEKNIQGKTDFYQKWNKLIEIFVEIVYSPKINIINCLFLKNKQSIQEEIKVFLAGIVKKLNKVSQKQLKIIKKNMFFDVEMDKIIHSTLSFNKQTKKYYISQDSEYYNCGQINFDLMVSLTHTELHNFMKNEKLKPLDLALLDTDLRDSLIDSSFFYRFCMYQIQFIKTVSNNQFLIHLASMIKIVNVVKLLYGFQEESCNSIFNQLKLLLQQKIQKTEMSQQTFINACQKTISQLSDVSCEIGPKKQELKEKEQLRRRKQLSKIKKQKLLKEKKMKENQQIYKIKPQQSPALNQQQQQCLICKQKQYKSNLCYFAKVRVNNLLKNLSDKTSKHLLFYSCFHMVHWYCFENQIKNRKVKACPLCSAACNIVLPSQNGSLQRVQFIETLLSNSFKGITQIKSEANEIMIFLGFQILLNLGTQYKYQQKQIILCKSLYRILLWKYYSQQNFVFTTNQLIEVNDGMKQIRKCIDIIKKYLFGSIKREFQTFYSQQQENDYFQQIFKQLLQFMDPSFSKKIVRDLFLITQPKGFQPLLYAVNQGQKNQNPHIFKFSEIPKTLDDLLKIRDECLCLKDLTHTPVICMICGQKRCYQCKKIRNHTQKQHYYESLYLKLTTGGFIYDSEKYQFQIRSIFTNKQGDVWKPQYASRQFYIDQEIFDSVFNAIRNGNLFYYLTHKFEGLKQKNLADII